MGVEITVAVLTRGRAALLRRCLDSFPPTAPDGIEVLLLVNGGDEGGAALAAQARERWPFLRVALLARVPRAAARNRALAEARGAYVHFLDDDTILPPGFLDRLRDAVRRHPEADSLGGPNLGAPGATAFQRAVDFLLRSPAGAGPMRARYVESGGERLVPGWKLMLCNLGVRRAALDARGLRFPDRCASAEENLLLWRLERGGGRALYCPQLRVLHERRRGAASFCRQVFQSGQGRVQISRVEPRSLLPVAVAPLAAALAAALLPWAWWRWGALTYAAACALESMRLALIERDPAAAALLPLLLPAAHASYAAGTLAGLWETACDIVAGRPPICYSIPESHRPPSCGTT